MIFSSTKNLHDGYYYYYYSVLLVRKVNVGFLQTVSGLYCTYLTLQIIPPQRRDPYLSR